MLRKFYLLFLRIELNKLLQKDNEEGNWDHADDANSDAGHSAHVSPRVVVAVAYGRHGDKAHPEGVYEVTEVLNLVIRGGEGPFTRLNDEGCYQAHDNHHWEQDWEGSDFKLRLNHKIEVWDESEFFAYQLGLTREPNRVVNV